MDFLWKIDGDSGKYKWSSSSLFNFFSFVLYNIIKIVYDNGNLKNHQYLCINDLEDELNFTVTQKYCWSYKFSIFSLN